MNQKTKGVVFQNDFSRPYIIVETSNGKHHVALEKYMLLPSNHRCLAVQGVKVQFDLIRGTDRDKLEARNLEVVGTFELQRRETSQVRSWDAQGGWGILQRDGCGCSVFCRFDAFSNNTSRRIAVAPGDVVEHTVVYTDLGFRAKNAVLNPREPSAETSQYFRWQQQTAQPELQEKS